jgi:phosphomannomutase
MAEIKFGTDGWRARLAHSFTFENINKVAKAFCIYVLSNKDIRPMVVIGYDNRFQSEDFALACAEVCSKAGLEVLLSDCAIPSPALSYAAKEYGALGIMITASHNPPNWNGFKIKETHGCSAFPETTNAIEEYILKTDKYHPSGKPAKISALNIKNKYLGAIKKLVDIRMIQSSGINVFVDPMFGSGLNLITEILGSGKTKVNEIHNYRDPLFGGLHPEPLPIYLQELQDTVKDNVEAVKAGIALDGDADRIAAVDEAGNYLSSHNVFSLLLKHLFENRKMKGEVVKTFNITKMIDKQCKNYEIKLAEVPIGFKYIAKIMLDKDILIGGEESGGIGIKGHLPERDGILAGLMLLEMMAVTKKGMGFTLRELMEEYGFYYYNRIDLHQDSAKSKLFIEKLKQDKPAEFAGCKVSRIETLDGLKVVFNDQSWILFRASGTEPLLRLYAEAPQKEQVEELLKTAEQIAKS